MAGNTLFFFFFLLGEGCTSTVTERSQNLLETPPLGPLFLHRSHFTQIKALYLLRVSAWTGRHHVSHLHCVTLPSGEGQRKPGPTCHGKVTPVEVFLAKGRYLHLDRITGMADDSTEGWTFSRRSDGYRRGRFSHYASWG